MYECAIMNAKHTWCGLCAPTGTFGLVHYTLDGSIKRLVFMYSQAICICIHLKMDFQSTYVIEKDSVC